MKTRLQCNGDIQNPLIAPHNTPVKKGNGFLNYNPTERKLFDAIITTAAGGGFSHFSNRRRRWLFT